jgi:transcriptional regulator with XRE-family HTH domain
MGNLQNQLRVQKISDNNLNVNQKLIKSQKMLLARQCKMARAALGWTVRDLAARSGVSHDTIVRLEGGGPALKETTIAKVQAAFEAVGIEFTNGGTPGVRFHGPDGSTLDAPAALPSQKLP